jgi:hypothetical protein
MLVGIVKPDSGKSKPFGVGGAIESANHDEKQHNATDFTD